MFPGRESNLLHLGDQEAGRKPDRALLSRNSQWLAERAVLCRPVGVYTRGACGFEDYGNGDQGEVALLTKSSW